MDVNEGVKVILEISIFTQFYTTIGDVLIGRSWLVDPF